MFREHHDPSRLGAGRQTEGTHYLWDGLQVAAEFDNTPGEGRPPLATYYYAGGRRIAKRMYGFHGRSSAGNEEFVRTRGGLLYYHEDRLGSVSAITDRHGEPVLRYAYEAYGAPVAGYFSPYNEYGFTGQAWDAAVGLYYYGARWYDPEAGRFLSEDPVRDGQNWYAYVYNNLLNWIDPWGLCGESLATEGPHTAGLAEGLTALAGAEVVGLGGLAAGASAAALKTGGAAGLIAGGGTGLMAGGLVFVGVDIIVHKGTPEWTTKALKAFVDWLK